VNGAHVRTRSLHPGAGGARRPDARHARRHRCADSSGRSAPPRPALIRPACHTPARQHSMAGRRLRAHGTDQCRGHAVLCASDPEHGRELWKSDGTAQRTVLVRDINPGPGHSIPSSPGTRGDVISANLTAVDDTVIFRAFDPAHGLEPWLSDGTAEGTVLVDDINPGSSASIPEGAPGRFTNVAGTVLFTAADSCIDPTRLRCDFEPWKTVPASDSRAVRGPCVRRIPRAAPRLNPAGAAARAWGMSTLLARCRIGFAARHGAHTPPPCVATRTGLRWPPQAARTEGIPHANPHTDPSRSGALSSTNATHPPQALSAGR
jgi:ELWxxDGT repeat protein